MAPTLIPPLAALKAGKHAIVEKPLEVTTERIDQLMDAAKANGKTLAAVSTAAFTPAWMPSKKQRMRSLRHPCQCLRLHQVVS